MLGKVAEGDCDHPIHLVYGVTNDGDLVEVETIAEYVKKIPSFTFATSSPTRAATIRSRATSPIISRPST